MNNILENMCMIYDRKNDKVLVLDKIKKHGWEGLTFPGGHIENGETIIESVIREVKEETGLSVWNLKLKGIVRWIDIKKDNCELCFMYYTENYIGNLIEKSNEGVNSWMKIDELKKSNGKSWFLDKIIELYLNDEYSELYVEWKDDTINEKIC